MKKLIISVLVLLCVRVYGQQDPLFSQYMFNKLLVNAGYTGSKEVLSIDLLDRYQWVGIDGAPRTFTFAAHTALKNRKVGVGIFAYRDALGPLINQGVMGSYSYRILMNNGILSFGLQAGAKFFNFNDLEEFLDDPLFNVTDIRKVTPDANFGIYYYSDRFFAGLSSKQLFENEYGVIRGEDGKTTYMRLARHMYGMAGAAFPLTEDMALRPSVLAKYVRNAPFQVEGNLSLVFDDKFLIGASYRTEKTVVLMTEIRIAKQIRVGYSFDMYMNELQGQSKGSHEIRIGLDFELFQTRMLSPRYFF